MDEPKLQEILDDAAERLALGRYSNADASVHALVAEVRRLTAALATARREARDGALRECLTIALTDGSTARIADGIAKLIGRGVHYAPDPRPAAPPAVVESPLVDEDGMSVAPPRWNR